MDFFFFLDIYVIQNWKKYKQKQQLNNFGETQQMSHCQQLWLRRRITVAKCDNVKVEL